MSKSSGASQRSCRQAQGLACDECRARKLRCDRARPTCGTCETLGVNCTPNTTRQPRGPRRGHLKALQSRITLERQLGGHPSENEESPPPEGNGVPSDHEQQLEAASDGYHEQSGAEEPSTSQTSTDQIAMLPATLMEGLSDMQSFPPVTFNYSFPPASSSYPGVLEQLSTADMETFHSMAMEFETSPLIPSRPSVVDSLMSTESVTPAIAVFSISELTKADLNHLYFDRVHLFAPILNKRRYFARAARPMSTTTPFVGLQHAMWTLAAWVGSQFKDIQKELYNHTRTILEGWEINIMTEAPPIELAQAWILLAIYEIMQINYDRGWLSAGRCFRLSQLMKLHEVDAPTGVAEAGLPYVETEERRRTFWMAYSLDRFINLINQMPLTLNEQVILTRLPAPEASFQRERPVKPRFLSEVLTGGSDVQHACSFNAYIVFVTISGRCLSHQQQCTVERAYGNIPQDFLTRHQWLERLLAEKTKTMLASSSDDLDDELSDPMLLFTHMVAHATTLLLGKAMQSVSWNYQEITTGYEQKVAEAAQKLSCLSEKLSELGYYKIHPFTPIPLFFCAEFAQGRKTNDPALQALYDSMASCLRSLGAVNMLAQTCLARFSSFTSNVDTNIPMGPTSTE